MSWWDKMQEIPSFMLPKKDWFAAPFEFSDDVTVLGILICPVHSVAKEKSPA